MNLKNTIIYYYTKLTYKIDKEEGLVQSYPLAEVLKLCFQVGLIYGLSQLLYEALYDDTKFAASFLESIIRMLYPVIYTLWVPLVLNLMPSLMLRTLEEKEIQSLEKRFIEEQKKVEEKENKIKQKQREKKEKEKRWRKEQWKTH